MRSILGREPAVFWNMCASVVMAVLLLFPWSDEVHGVVNAAVLAVAGFATAAMVSVDAALPALAGVIKAVFAVLLAFGTDVPVSAQVAILAVVSAVGSFWVRQQVTSRVGPVQAGGAHAPFASAR